MIAYTLLSVTDRIGTEDQQTFVENRDLVASLQVVIPISDSQVRNAVDLDGDGVFLPLHVEVVATVSALAWNLPGRLGQSEAPTNLAEIPFGEGLYSTMSIKN